MHSLSKCILITSIAFVSSVSANTYSQQESVFISEDLDDASEQEFEAYHKDRQERLSKLVAMVVEYNQKMKDCPDLEMRRGAFLLTGVIVYQALRWLGHASIWIAAGTSIVGGFALGGPGGAAAAYLNALATIPSASAFIETSSLVVGTAASWIPGLP